ncbi:MAG: DUF447 domain-containing protein [archaeon]
MTKLQDLGFREGTISETIVSTCDLNGNPNAAPMGIEIKNSNQLVIRPFVTSLTYKNIQETHSAVVNITFEPNLFYVTAFKEANPDGKLSTNLFENAKTVSAPRLKSAKAFVEVFVKETHSIGVDRVEFLCDFKHIETVKILPKVYCRAQFATIEAIIHATRIELFLKGNEQQQKRGLKLVELVNVCQDVVNKTAPNSVYSKIMNDLNKRIESWRNTQ